MKCPFIFYFTGAMLDVRCSFVFVFHSPLDVRCSMFICIYLSFIHPSHSRSESSIHPETERFPSSYGQPIFQWTSPNLPLFIQPSPYPLLTRLLQQVPLAEFNQHTFSPGRNQRCPRLNKYSAIASLWTRDISQLHLTGFKILNYLLHMPCVISV